ncbi:hypothetical protein ACO2Q7_13615 [Rathayibacter sp. KR2-224]|uniref:hypothetical protein n=1 Tax=Rathayibacter sp. KR2-224 TaxID=3400913 RepID=UPI003BFAED3D
MTIITSILYHFDDTRRLGHVSIAEHPFGKALALMSPTMSLPCLPPSSGTIESLWA